MLSYECTDIHVDNLVSSDITAAVSLC